MVNNKYYLRPDYDVHHLNFDKQDNRPENLRVLTRAEHTELHNRIKALTGVIKSS